MEQGTKLHLSLHESRKVTQDALQVSSAPLTDGSPHPGSSASQIIRLKRRFRVASFYLFGVFPPKVSPTDKTNKQRDVKSAEFRQKICVSVWDMPASLILTGKVVGFL